MFLQTAIDAEGKQSLLIHFVSRDSVLHPWKIACAPNATDLHAVAGVREAPWLRSDDSRAVSCPFCMKTEEFALARARVRRVAR